MSSDEYKVEILHFINPHLIWVLVENTKEENKYYFEQIGIYGILPLNVTIDYEGTVISKRSEEWLPAVFVAMKKILLDASEVWFSVTFIDRKISIFDDNIHKFGDLTIKMKDGQTISMVQKLLDTGFAVADVPHFYQNLNVKLDYVNIVTVTNKIKQTFNSLNIPVIYLENALIKQSSVFRKSLELKEELPPNVDVSHHYDHQQVHKKIYDINACKDIDEKSAGRATNVKVMNASSKLNMGLMKKLTLIQNGGLDLCAAVTGHDVNNQRDLSSDNDQKSYAPIDYKQYKRGKSKAKDPNKEKKMIAFGPPDINPTKYHLIEIKEDIKEEVKEEIRVEKTEKEDEDNVDRAESEVNIKLNYLATLKKNMKHKSASNNNNVSENNVQDENPTAVKKVSSSLQRKMKVLKEKMARANDSSSTVDTDSSLRQGDDSDSESIISLVHKLDVSECIKQQVIIEPVIVANNVKYDVNPFKNLDGSKSVFVEKLVTPTLMVHTKKGNRIQPVSNMRDIPFGSDILIVLRNMSVRKPMRLQTVSWPMILRGHSLFLVSPCDSGKTLGYLPAVCRIVSDCKKTGVSLSVARLTCIIVCATANSVYNVEEMCKMFLHDAVIFACYAGMTDMTISTSILNGCDILICTPTLLIRIIREDLGLDLRNLNTVVIDDCERISEVYQNEIKYCLYKVREMLKSRINREHKVQYVVASRMWCSFMSTLARKAPDSIVCIAAFQECVLYSEVNTSVEFLQKKNKVEAVIKFLKDIDNSKKTVIVCRTDDEVHILAITLMDMKKVVFSCDSTMTLHELYNIDLALSDYNEPLLGPILVCCDSNLAHLNITDAHYLIHFSLPELFSTFCKRFAVLIDNYPSIFSSQDSDVRIKILFEQSNVEQLPKILHFIKRCTDDVPAVLDEICAKVTSERDLKKAQSFVPLCNALLSLGKCPDIWYCKQRHAIFQEFDEASPWLPREGIITFKILHYHSAVHYSGRMLSCTTNGETKKYSQSYSMLSIKLGMYYSREINRKLHGVAKPGDVCAVSLKHNLFARCQVIKIMQYTRNNIPSLMLINLIDEEKYEMARDTCLYHLPDDLKKIESQAVKIMLANLAPKDRDISYSKLAVDQIKNITEQNDEFYMRGQIALVIGKCIFVDTLHVCQDLSSLNETVVKCNIRTELLDGYAINNPDHISALQKLGGNLEFMRKEEAAIQTVEIRKPIKLLPKARWAHLESDAEVPVYYLYARSPNLFFVQHVKFQNCLNYLLKDIKKYVSENPEPVFDVKEGDIVLAEFADDGAYERARIDGVIDDNKVKCFFVDLGDWRIVSTDKLLSITEKLITQLPFQAIECRLVGIKPVGFEWSEFAINWLVDQFYDSSANLKYLFAKRFTKETAEVTDSVRYGIGLIDTYANDVFINVLMIEANLAEVNSEIEYLTDMIFSDEEKSADDDTDGPSIIEEGNSLENEEDNPVEENTPSEVSTSNDISKEVLSYKMWMSSQDVDMTDENGAQSSNLPTEPNQDNQLALKDGFQSGQNAGSSKSSNVSEENVPSNQRTVMDWIRRVPIRSMPLVDNDDIDDDRWDTQNPLLMFNSNNQANITEVSDTKKETTEAKIAPFAIKSSGDDNIHSKPDCKVTKSTSSSDNKINVSTPPKTKQLNNSSDSGSAKEHDALKLKSEPDIWSILEDDDTLTFYDKGATNNDGKFKLSCTQDKSNVTITILEMAEKYELIIKDKHIQFCTNAKEYGFELELYDVIDIEKSSHFNTGTHIEVKLRKVLNKTWLQLNVGSVKKIKASIDNKTDKTAAKTNKSEINIQEQSPKASEVKVYHTNKNNLLVTPEDNLRKPKIVWRQNKCRVTVKIQLITEKYHVIIKERYMKFSSNANDEDYGFELELYGIVDVENCSHSNKGQYIQINLTKVKASNWLTLSKGSIKKWIVYDVDNIDVSSDDENESAKAMADLQKSLNIKHDSDSEDDFIDDTNF